MENERMKRTDMECDGKHLDANAAAAWVSEWVSECEDDPLDCII